MRRFAVEHQAVRGEFVLLGPAWLALREHSDYPPAVRNLLGEAVVASVLLASTLKFEGELTLQMQGTGAVRLLVAQCTNDFKVRAVARFHAARFAEGDSAMDFSTLAGEGTIEIVDSHTVKLNLPVPDISLIAGMSDYPAAITHADNNLEDMFSTQIGTGPYLAETNEAGVKAVLVRNADHDWWGYAAGKGAYMDKITYIDLGTDPSALAAAAASDEVDMLYETTGDFIEVMDGLGWDKSEIASGATVSIRTNQVAEVDGKMPYADKRVRQAIAMSVDNAVCLELGVAGLGQPARNQHVGPMHPEWADVPALPYDPAAAMALMTEAGMQDYEFDLISVDDDWLKNTNDVVAAQMRDAGFNVKRTVIPGSTFWNDWTKYPFSSTNWNHRPLGTQVLALAYKSGEAWNESGFANAEFDTLLTEANSLADADKRREVMAKIQAIMTDEGVTVQPYWRSIFRHAKPGLVGWDMHIAYLPQIYKIAYAA